MGMFSGTEHVTKGVKLFIGSKVLCVFYFEICTPAVHISRMSKQETRQSSCLAVGFAHGSHQICA